MQIASIFIILAVLLAYLSATRATNTCKYIYISVNIIYIDKWLLHCSLYSALDMQLCFLKHDIVIYHSRQALEPIYISLQLQQVKSVSGMYVYALYKLEIKCGGTKYGQISSSFLSPLYNVCISCGKSVLDQMQRRYNIEANNPRITSC